MSNSLTLIVHLTSQQQKIDDTKALLMSMVEKTRPENGCVHYDLFQSNENPAHFTFYETWTGHEALDVHMQTAHVRELYLRKEDLLLGDPDVRFMTMVSRQVGQ